MAQAVKEYAATGRRKEATARVRLSLGEGKISVNGKPSAEYFPVESMQLHIDQPFAVTGTQKKYDVVVNAQGGGLNGQAGAVRHGIARALTLADAELRAPLKAAGCLTRDAREKERKKYGQPGARKRFQFSKR